MSDTLELNGFYIGDVVRVIDSEDNRRSIRFSRLINRRGVVKGISSYKRTIGISFAESPKERVWGYPYRFIRLLNRDALWDFEL